MSLARQVFSPATPGLWIPGDEASGDLTNRGSLGGAAWVARGTTLYRQSSIIGYALSGASGGRFTSVTGIFVGNVSYSVAGWINTTSTDSVPSYAGSNIANVILGDWSSAVERSFGIHGGLVKYNHFSGAAWAPTVGVTPVNTGVWRMIGLAYDTVANTSKVYVDGVLDGSSSGVGNNSAGASFCSLGAGYGDGTQTGPADTFDGRYFGLGIWSAVLADVDFLRIYQAGIRSGVVL